MGVEEAGPKGASSSAGGVGGEGEGGGGAAATAAVQEPLVLAGYWAAAPAKRKERAEEEEEEEQWRALEAAEEDEDEEEAASLRVKKAETEDWGSEEQGTEIKEVRGWPKIKRELRLLLALALPILVADGARFAMGLTDTAFVGHLGSSELAAASLAGVWMDCTMYFGIGLIFAMDTLVSQAEGAKNYRMIGITLAVSTLLDLIASVPIGLAWWFAGDVLLLGGIDEDVARLAASFARCQIPGLFPYLVYRSVIRYLMGQEITTPSMITNWIAVFINGVLNWVLIQGAFGWSGLGFIGSPIATAISRTLCPLMLWTYVLFRGYHKKTWAGWTYRDVFQAKLIWNYVKLGVPSSLMLAFEVSGLEAVTFMAGRLGESIVDAHVVTMQLLFISYVIPLALSLGTATRVGKYMGENKPKEAKFASTLGLGFTAIVMLGSATVMLIGRRYVILIFTNEPGIVSLASTLVLWGAVVTFFDGQIAVTSGVLRGIGKPLPCTILNFIGYYLIGMPVCIGLAFHTELGVHGLWLGLTMTLAFVMAGNFVVLRSADWDKEAHAAQLRVGNDIEMKQLLPVNSNNMDNASLSSTEEEEADAEAKFMKGREGEKERKTEV